MGGTSQATGGSRGSDISVRKHKNGVGMHFECDFARFRIQTLTSSHPCMNDVAHSRICVCTSLLNMQLTCDPLLISSSHPDLNREGRWVHDRRLRNQFPPFSPVLHCPLGLGELQACPFPDAVFPLLPLSVSLWLARWFWPDLMNGRHEHTTAICISLRWSGGLRVVRLPAGSWHGLPRG